MIRHVYKDIQHSASSQTCVYACASKILLSGNEGYDLLLSLFYLKSVFVYLIIYCVYSYTINV